MNWIVEHKRFVVFVVAAVVLVFIEYYYFIADIQDEYNSLREQQYKLRLEIETQVKKGQFISEKSIQNAEEEIKFVENRYATLRNKINFKPLPGYQIPPNIKPNELMVSFQPLLKETQKRLEKTAAQKGIPIPAKLEFPLSRVSDETIRLYYERLDILEQLVNIAMDSNCQKIPDWGVNEGDFREFRDIKETLLKTSSGTKNLVFIRVNGTFGSTMQFINLLRSAERFVSLERVIVNKTNPDIDVDNVTATFIVAGVKLDEPR